MRYLLAAAVFILSGGAAYADPEFNRYPVGSIYNGPHAKPDFTGKDAVLFRTRIRDASKKPINFSGEYSLQTWGCGTGCETGVVVNIRTGQVSFLPSVESSAGDATFVDRFQYKATSSLLVATGTIGEDKGTYEYLFRMEPSGLVAFGKKQISTENEASIQADTQAAPTNRDQSENYVSVLKAPFSEGIWRLTFVAKSDKLAIQSISINRGNCQISSPAGETGARLKFGDRWSVLVKCNPIELVINSDQGSGKITWDN
ncbi:hypothetical protein AB4037_23440 [Labrys sp. KB_33_2]|uniref:hypothetical protein n=1 Tax=Labrys sp. KB_33_2 TaxID=3237479 RepID=UPI003F8EF708